MIGTYSEFTHPGRWEALYAELPDDLQGLIGVVKNLLIHPSDIRKHGIRISPARRRELSGLFTVSRMLEDVFRRPPVSLVAYRSPYHRVVEPCDFQAVLFSSFCRYKGYEIRSRCGFARHISPGRWVPHWLNEVRKPFFTEWMYVDADRECFPAREDFRTGAEWWRIRKTENIQGLRILRYRGLAAVKYMMLNDFNSLNGRELIHCRWMNPRDRAHGPSVYHLGCSQLAPEQREFLDRIAQAVVDSDARQAEILFRDPLYRASVDG